MQHKININIPVQCLAKVEPVDNIRKDSQEERLCTLIKQDIY